MRNLYLSGLFAASLLFGGGHTELFAKTDVQQHEPSFVCDRNFKEKSHYASVIEKLLYYKSNEFSVFYGGPITHKFQGVRWVMFASFEGESRQIRSYYEIAFVNCTPGDASGAELLYVEVPDIDVKFANMLTNDYSVFNNLCCGGYSKEKYVIIRYGDVGIPYYPNFFIADCYSSKDDKDKDIIVEFLHSQFKTKDQIKESYISQTKHEREFETEDEISYKPIPLLIEINGLKQSFYLTKKVLKHDDWKLYYMVHSGEKYAQDKDIHAKPPFFRVDSGCLIGQIYDDEACDCKDQLKSSLGYLVENCSKNGLVIHVPLHDGRGFGSAPKAETEIYKLGGQGRVFKTEQLDTISAAKMLYQSDFIDLRTFGGPAKMLKDLKIDQVMMYTDNRIKVNTLNHAGIKTHRIPTNTAKDSCIEHIQAKKNHEDYYH